MDAAAVAHHRGLQAVMNAAPIVSIATAKERAWERLRFAILINLHDPNDALRPIIERRKADFLAACHPTTASGDGTRGI